MGKRSKASAATQRLPYTYRWSGERLRERIEASGLSQAHVARVTDQTVRSIQNWLGGIEPEAWRQLAIADALGCDPRDFYEKVPLE